MKPNDVDWDGALEAMREEAAGRVPAKHIAKRQTEAIISQLENETPISSTKELRDMFHRGLLTEEEYGKFLVAYNDFAEAGDRFVMYISVGTLGPKARVEYI